MKLFIIVRSTLAAGLLAAQAVHAFRAFTLAYPAQTAAWDADNNIVILQHDDLPVLADLLDSLGLAVARFHEPDMGDALTAICLEPAGKRHVAKLKLVGRA